MDADTKSHDGSTTSGEPPWDDPRPRVIDAAEIFCGQQEVWIDFHGERYRLRITRRGRLILQK